ncbi:polysaccharide pyruvyl transferase family protein [Phycisphaerales bacterium AB-hyl4]|uniref:Polysaccharide pyruvyl transferase family protein n=1 Tax=Natronomicrosphaera hydrolytica TaxID=3242702 RepID=A0ABV4U633_9BACT
MKLCLFGAATGTGNLGVSALCQSALTALFREQPEASVTVFDYGRSRRRARMQVDGESRQYQVLGAVYSRRYYLPENLRLMQVAGRLGLPFPVGVRAIRAADAVLDVSGGDSFTDLYGDERFAAITLPKQLALDLGRPLVLLPQTYGPFRDPARRQYAAELVRGAHVAWARDQRSFELMKELLGDDFDPDRHRCGVDMAFALEPSRPENVPERIVRWLTDRKQPVVGVNVSGLLANPEKPGKRYGLRADYRETVFQLVDRLLRETDTRVVLVPHVVTPPGHYESDHSACQALADRFQKRADAADRLAVLTGIGEADQVKWVIGQLDWFCGTRMHSTIAALSSGVPAAALSYSDKTLGVFESCNLGSAVVDPRLHDTAETVDRLWQVWLQREQEQTRLRGSLPGVVTQARDQMRWTLQSCLPEQLGHRMMAGGTA